jgi:hypothetical protein
MYQGNDARGKPATADKACAGLAKILTFVR